MSTATIEAAVEQKMAPTNWADPTGKGIIAGMDEFFDGPSKVEPAPVAVSTPPVATKEPVSEPPAQVVPKEVKEPEKTLVEDIIDEGFFKSDKVEEKKPEPGVFDEVAFDKETEESSKELGEKAGARFKELRSELKAAKQSIPPATLLKELEEAKVKAQEVDGLRERMKELSGQSAKLTVETSDEYINEVKKPLTNVFATLDKLSAVYEMDPTILRALVREDDRKVQDELIKTHLVGFSDLSKNEVFAATVKFNELLDKRDAMMENAEKDLGAREAKRIQESERLLAEQRKSVQTLQLEKWSRWEKAIPGLLDANGSPTPEYSKMKNEALSLDFSQARANDMAFAALSGVLLPFAQKQIIALQRELEEYRKGDKKALAGAPGSGSSVAQTPSNPSKPKTFMEGFMDADLR